MKVYTKTGDKGITSLVDGTRVSKCDERVEAYGTVDELTAFTALLRAELELLKEGWSTAVSVDLTRVECMLMKVSALLAAGGCADGLPRVSEEDVLFLEGRMDAMQRELPSLTGFTIPGGSRCVSLCHVCRTVCRRAERASWRSREYAEVDERVFVLLNRLSDYFYVLGRMTSVREGVAEELWRP